jgi:hypothetical protein
MLSRLSPEYRRDVYRVRSGFADDRCVIHELNGVSRTRKLHASRTSITTLTMADPKNLHASIRTLSCTSSSAAREQAS